MQARKANKIEDYIMVHKNSFEPTKKKITIEELMALQSFKEYNELSHSLAMSAEALAIEFMDKGIKKDQLGELIAKSDRSVPMDYKTAMQDYADNVPDSYQFTSFMPWEKSKRDELSKKAEISYVKAIYTTEVMKMGLTRAVKDGLLSQEQFDELSKSRDTLVLLLKAGDDDKTYMQNVETAKKLLGANLDQSKLTPAEFEDAKKKQFAEILNQRMKELAETDYSKYESMSDEQLVQQFEDYDKDVQALSIIEREVNSWIKNNPYINRNLYNKTRDINGKLGNFYFANSCRMRAIANPHYKTADMLDELYMPSSDVAFITVHTEDEHLNRFRAEITALTSVQRVLLDEQTYSKLSETLEDDFQPSAIRYFDKKGNMINTEQAIIQMKKDGFVMASAQGYPKSTIAINYDPKTLGFKTLSPEKYKSYINIVNSKLLDSEAAHKAVDDAMEKNSEYLKDLKGITTSLIEKEQAIATDAVTKGLPIEDYLQRHMASAHPQMSYDEFAKKHGIKDDEKISKLEINQRRALTHKAIKAVVNSSIRRYEGEQFPPELHNIIAKKVNMRNFSDTLCKWGKENLAANIKMAQEFFGLDENNKPTGISEEELNKKRNEIIRNRVKDWAKIQEKLLNIEMTDENIIEHYEELDEYGLGQGMEWNLLMEQVKGLGCTVDDDIIELGFKNNRTAYLFNNIHSVRAGYIASQYYQYGGEEHVNTPEMLAEIPAATDKTLGMTYAGAFTAQSQISSELGAIFKSQMGGSTEDIDFIYDEKGGNIAFDDMSIGNTLTQGSLMVFKKGQKDPVMFSASNLKRVPPIISERLPSPAELAQSRAARFDGMITRIENDRKLSPAQKRIQSEMLESEYELGIMADGIQNLSGERLEGTKASIRRNLVKYVSRAVANKYMNKNADYAKKFGSEKNINEFVQRLSKAEGIDMLLDEMIKDPNSFNNMDPEKIVASFQKHQKEVMAKDYNDLTTAKHNEYLESSQKARTAASFLMSVGGVHSPSFWGLSTVASEQTKAMANDFGCLSLDRGALQAIACGLMVKDGKSFDQIVAMTPEMKEARSEYTQAAIDLVVGLKHKEVGDALLAGMTALNEYLAPYANKMKDFTLGEISAPEFTNAVMASDMLMDFTQEIDGLKRHADENNIQMSPEFNADTIKEQNQLNEKLRNLFTNRLTGPTSALSEIAEINFNTKDPAALSNARNKTAAAIGNYLKSMVLNKTLKAISELPENAGKSPMEFEKVEAIKNAAQLALEHSDDFNAFIKKGICQQTKFAKKSIIAMLDGTIEKELDLKIKIPKDPSETVSIEADFNKMFKAIKGKTLSDPEIKAPEVKAPEKAGPEIQEPVLDGGAAINH